MKKLSKRCFQIASIALFTFIMPSYCSEQPWYNSISEESLYNKSVAVKCFQITSIALFAFIIPSYCSEQPWYNSIIEKSLYNMFAVVINFAMGIRAMIYKPIMAINPDKFIKILNNRLAQIEKNIRADEQNQFYEIAKEHDLGDTDIKIGLEIIDKMNLSYRESHSKLNLDVVHDKNISAELFSILQKKLAEENIDINSVSITNSDVASPDGVDAQCKHDYKCNYTIQDDGLPFASYSNNKPINITFYPKFHLFNKCMQQGICIHEATHIIEGHGITQVMVSAFIGDVTQKNPSDVEKSKNFQKLVQIHERQAEVLPSLKDRKIASLMREHRFTDYYPNMLYGKHYLQLSEIDEAYKMIAYLEQG